jgi:hypothetical protein
MVMIEAKVLQSLKERYPHIHPLIFLRSAERARSGGDLFDILEGFPNQYPVTWNDETHGWVRCDDILQSRKFEEFKEE